VTIARRKGDEWFAGTINNSEERQVMLPLSWLPPGRYTATVYSDAADAGAFPDHLVVERRSVGPADTLIVRLAAGGGQVIRLRKD
jgi:alpha-glucosidase